MKTIVKIKPIEDSHCPRKDNPDLFHEIHFESKDNDKIKIALPGYNNQAIREIVIKTDHLQTIINKIRGD